MTARLFVHDWKYSLICGRQHSLIYGPHPFLLHDSKTIHSFIHGWKYSHICGRQDSLMHNHTPWSMRHRGVTTYSPIDAYTPIFPLLRSLTSLCLWLLTPLSPRVPIVSPKRTIQFWKSFVEKILAPKSVPRQPALFLCLTIAKGIYFHRSSSASTTINKGDNMARWQVNSTLTSVVKSPPTRERTLLHFSLLAFFIFHTLL